MMTGNSKELEEFKANYKQRIADVAKSKTEWIKDFVESQKPKGPVKTVADMYMDLKKEEKLLDSQGIKFNGKFF